ncbi:EAL domain-containing protein, partial [Streptomyces sp. 12297]
QLPADPVDVKIVEGIVALAHSLELAVTVEGVETGAQAAQLRALGCDMFAQYFHLSINSITWFARIGFFVGPVIAFIITKRICLGLQRRDRDKVLHGRETGIIKRLPHGEFVEVHEPLSPGQLHTLTSHEQYKPAEIGPTVDENGVERKVKLMEKLRVKLSKGYYGQDNQIPKASAEEYKEIQSGHGHH